MFRDQRSSIPHPSPACDPVAPDAAPARRWLVLAVTVAAAVMDQLDGTIVTLAGPSIRSDLGGGEGTLQWYVAAYTLPFAVLLITGGRLGDRYGRRATFLVGATGFTVLSLLCAVAATPGMLIGARVVQGAFGAVLIPQGFGLVRSVFPADQLARAFSVFAPAMGLASVAGPTVAGALIDADLFGTGWRLIFLINVPIGLAIIAGAARSLPQHEDRRAIRLDVRGIGLLCAAVGLLVYPLVQGRAAGWAWWTFGLIALGVAGFGAFAVYERRTSRDPVIEPSLLANRTFLAGLAVVVVFFAATTGYLLVITVWMQTALRFSPLHAGLTGLPLSIGIAAAAAASPRLLRRAGCGVLRSGLAIVAVGMASLGAAVVLGSGTFTSWQLAPFLLVTGAGMGLVFGPLFGTVLAAVADPEVGSASGTLSAVQQLGGALGVAAIATLYFALAAHPARHSIAVAAAAAAGAAAVLIAYGLAGLLPQQARARR